MALIRTILALLVLLVLFHVGMVYAGVSEETSGLTSAIYSLGALVEAPAQFAIDYLPLSGEQRNIAGGNGFYVVALGAAALYFILYLLLGVGKR